MSSDGFAVDPWRFRVKSEDLGGHGVYSLVATSEGDEYLIGEAWTREVAGHIVQVHNATLDTDPIAQTAAMWDVIGKAQAVRADDPVLLMDDYSDPVHEKSRLLLDALFKAVDDLARVTRKDSTDGQS